MSTIQFSLLVTDEPGVISKITMILQKLHIIPIKQLRVKTSEPSKLKLIILANGSNAIQKAAEQLKALKGVISILHVGASNKSSEVDTVQSKKSQCKEIIANIFGESVAKTVDSMNEDNCITLCRAKVAGLAGEEAAKAFDRI